MNDTAEIYLWNTRIGIIHTLPSRAYSSFEYDNDFLKSGIELSPIKMPLSTIIYQFPDLAGSPFFGMPGLVADSLPDKFGNEIINQWLLFHGHSLSDFTAIDRLCYTGKRGMGALEFVPSTSDIQDINKQINVNEMVKFASDILTSRTKTVLDSNNTLTYAQLVQVGSSAGGARAKALIAWNEKTNEVKSGQIKLGKGFDYWLMKFDNVSNNGDHNLIDRPEYTLIEYAYYKMAIASGIHMEESRIYESEGLHHFMTKRFDRKNGEKIHMQSLGALAHISYQDPCVCGYELACMYMKQLGLSPTTIAQFYRRMVFNCLAINQDDHVKNISFLMDKHGVWSLSPAYDITFAYNPDNRWLRSHQMTINGKNVGITCTDLIESGQNMGLSTRQCKDIINEVKPIVLHFSDYAEDVGIKGETINYINGIIKENMV